MNAVSEIAPSVFVQPHVVGEFRTSETLMALTASLAKASLAFDEVTRNKEVSVRTQQGQTYKFKYATLDSIIAATFPALHANGLVVFQIPVMAASKSLVLITRLQHESGEFVEAGLPLIQGSDPKALGSDITYKRRYGLSALLGIPVEDDDDAGAASGHATQTLRESAPQRRQQPPAQSRPPARDDADSPSPPDDASPGGPVWDVVSGSTGQVQTAEDGKKWLGMWSFRLQKLGEGTKDTPAQKRATLVAMRDANAAVFARLAESGQGAVVQEVTKAVQVLETKLNEQERGMGAPE